MAGNFLGMDFAPEHDTPMGVVAKVRGNVERLKEESRTLAVEAAHLGADVMRAEAPEQSGGLKGRIEADADAAYHAGGAGGGGFWEASSGVIDLGPDQEYPLYVFRGTGRKVGKDAIYPNPGNVFPLNGLVQAVTGSMLYRQWQTGQEPQKGWVENAQEAARRLIDERLGDIPASASR